MCLVTLYLSNERFPGRELSKVGNRARVEFTCMDDPRKLLLEIANCPVATDLLTGCMSAHPCRTIISSQPGKMFQLPEPWVGEIDHAPILFISSNPSIDQQEQFPINDEAKWPAEVITDFFECRFTSKRGWVMSGKVLRKDGSRGDWVRFWASARNRACEILQKGKDDVRIGIDFALTEVVHCKSRNEVGVSEAREFCSDRYLERILNISAANLLIVYGVTAREAICGYLGITTERGPITVEKNSRIFVFLPRPNARRTKKTLEGNLSGDEMSRVRMHVKQRAGK